jgi:hypothetical protein
MRRQLVHQLLLVRTPWFVVVLSQVANTSYSSPRRIRPSCRSFFLSTFQYPSLFNSQRTITRVAPASPRRVARGLEQCRTLSPVSSGTSCSKKSSLAVVLSSLQWCNVNRLYHQRPPETTKDYQVTAIASSEATYRLVT